MDLKDHLVSPPTTLHVPLDQVAQGLTEPGFELSQGWSIHNLRGQPVPVSKCSRCHRSWQEAAARAVLFFKEWILQNLCYPKTHCTRKLQNLHCLTKLLVLKFHREAIAVHQSGEWAGVWRCVSNEHDHIVLDGGSTVGPSWSQELPLETGATVFASAVLKADVWTVQGV